MFPELTVENAEEIVIKLSVPMVATSQANFGTVILAEQIVLGDQRSYRYNNVGPLEELRPFISPDTHGLDWFKE